MEYNKEEDYLYKLSQLPFYKPIELDRSLDQERVEEYLIELKKSLKNPSFKLGKNDNIEDIYNIIKDSLYKCKYVNFDTFWDKVNLAFDQFVEYIADEDFYLVVSGNKVGSETWIIQGLAKRILELPGYKGFIVNSDLYDEDISQITTLVTIDDCIYSGIQQP